LGWLGEDLGGFLGGASSANSLGKYKESPFGKAGFKSKRWRKLTFKVSFLFFLEHLLGKPFK
jgi:hypothetical protein